MLPLLDLLEKKKGHDMVLDLGLVVITSGELLLDTKVCRRHCMEGSTVRLELKGNFLFFAAVDGGGSSDRLMCDSCSP